MKKTLTLLAILAAIGPAWGAEVVSSNIVGYEKVTLTAGLNLIGSQFVLVGGDTATMNELTTSMEGQSGYDDDSYDPTTELRIWTGSGYAQYGWTGDLLTDSPALAEEMGVDDHSFDNQWLNGDYEIAEDEMDVGKGFWIKAKTAGTVVMSGEVPNSDTITVSLSPGLNLVSYPWPMAADMQKIQVSGQTGYDDDSYDPTTELRVWTGSGYAQYGWSGNLLEESPSLADEMGVTDHSLDNKWLNGDYEVESKTIDYGKGFWIKAPNSGSVTFSK
jgi:hypothetical protein